MFETVLVANRGEIARRVIRTLRRLGIRSVAVYSDADAGAVFVGEADVAVRLGPASAAESYLNIPAIVRAAQATGAQAIHPGYGFLSENAEFAAACEAAGIVFIGPPAAAIDVMGDKIRAKHHVGERAVPLIPGGGEPGMTDEQLVAVAAEVGFPLIIKPSAGGGGKGMTVVERSEELAESLVTARRVARAAFGDDTLLLERYVSAPRHIEVQVLADTHGAIVHLGERECSLQRRHQKIVEEAPSPLLTPEQRERMGAAAVEVARSVDYVGVGTVEFLVSDAAPDEFFFMEMNTRLQVEHPVTELVTGLDLVEQQLLVASGEPLAFGQRDVALTGHAIEARLCAEDAAAGFLPATGRVLRLVEPTGPGIRTDSSLADGLVIGSDYDSLLSKVVGFGADRAEALAALDDALAGTVVLGVRTNRDFLRELLADPDVRAGRLDTGLIARVVESDAETPRDDSRMIAAAALIQHASRWRVGSAWNPADGWRSGGTPRPAGYRIGDNDVTVSGSPSDARVALDGRELTASGTGSWENGTYRIVIGDGSADFSWSRDGDRLWLASRDSAADFALPTRERLLADHRATLTRGETAGDPQVRTPMPGTVVAVAVATGDTVETGQLVATIEAMKMEHRLLASQTGVVTVDVATGDRVSLDQVIATIHPQEGDLT